MITLSNINDHSLQDIFDQCADHLLSQGRRSMRGSICGYLSGNGDKCAVGCFISEDEYDEAMEGKTIAATSFERFGINSDKFGLLMRLQKVHDWSAPEHWKEQLEILAQEKGFKVNF